MAGVNRNSDGSADVPAASTLTVAGTINTTGTFKIGGTAVTSSAAELNILDGVTASTAELNILDGVTSSAAELNILDGVTRTAAEINAIPATTGATGANVATVANAAVIGGVPVLYRIDVADASADTDVISTHKIRVIDAWGVNTGIGAHAANDTWQVKNGTDAISDAVAKTATVNGVKRVGSINPTYAEIAAAGTLRITAVKDTNAAVTVYVLAIRVA